MRLRTWSHECSDGNDTDSNLIREVRVKSCTATQALPGTIGDAIIIMQLGNKGAAELVMTREETLKLKKALDEFVGARALKKGPAGTLCNPSFEVVGELI